MTDSPSILRSMLLRNILRDGEDVVEKSACDTLFFPDMTIGLWCMRHELQCVLETHTAETRGAAKDYSFYTFRKIDDSEL